MKTLIFSSALLLMSVFITPAQTTEFTYQGNLKDGASAANGNYDIQFSLFAIDTGGSAIGTLQKMAVPVANGSFTVKLDFGAQFPGAVRYLELAVRPAGAGSFTTLAPRQQISNAPYAVRSLNAANADNATTATTATDAQQLGGITANQYVVTTDARLSDARNPLSGSANYIQNTTTTQATSNFNISGDGTAAGTLTANIVAAATQFNIGPDRILSAPSGNIFGGQNAGAVNTGSNNAFFGNGAGLANTSGFGNSFFGRSSGLANTTGQLNTFYGANSGLGNTTGGNNVFVGFQAGKTVTTGSNNTVVGSGADAASNNLSFATAIGAGATVAASNTIAIGRSGGQDAVQVPGNLSVTGALSGNGAGITNINGANIAGGTITSTALASDAQPTGSNLKLLASLRWDLLKAQASFPVGNSPISVGYDGANIWVVNLNGGSVTKLRASDGTNLGSFPTGTGNPNSVAFDGANIWVTTNGSTNNVTKLRASDGANLGSFSFAGGSSGVVFDGSSIWFGTNPNLVVKLRPSDGAILGTFTAGTSALSLAFDGANIWSANFSSNNVTKLRASDGANLGTFPVGTNPEGIVFDGTNIWVANFNSSNVTKLRASDGANLGTFPVGTEPTAIAFDGTNIWVANTFGNSLTKLRASDGTNLGTFPTGVQPSGMAFDGTNIWLAVRNDNVVTRLPPAFPEP
jgi:hypothetical protein